MPPKKRNPKQAKDAMERLMAEMQGELEIKRYGFPVNPGAGQLEYELRGRVALLLERLSQVQSSP